MNAQNLLSIYQAFANMADDFTGIPSYAHGNDNVRGAGRTLGGLSMLMSSAARGMKMVIGRIDLNVLQSVIHRQFNFNRQYDPDESIKGDIEIQPRGALAQIIKEQITARRMEFLQSTQNELDNTLIGHEGRRIELEEISKSLDYPEGIVRTKEVVEQEMAKQQAQAQAEAMQAQPAGVAA
jgi:hypothetical protein